LNFFSKKFVYIKKGITFVTKLKYRNKEMKKVLDILILDLAVELLWAADEDMVCNVG
jgi:hypothetical protein